MGSISAELELKSQESAGSGDIMSVCEVMLEHIEKD